MYSVWRILYQRNTDFMHVCLFITVVNCDSALLHGRLTLVHVYCGPRYWDFVTASFCSTAGIVGRKRHPSCPVSSSRAGGTLPDSRRPMRRARQDGQMHSSRPAESPSAILVVWCNHCFSQSCRLVWSLLQSFVYSDMIIDHCFSHSCILVWPLVIPSVVRVCSVLWSLLQSSLSISHVDSTEESSSDYVAYAFL